MFNTTHSKVTMIVPCAGFGTRAGNPPAKELLLHPTHHRPFIDHCLLMAQKYNWTALLITRPEKRILIDYVQEKAHFLQINIQWILVKKTLEWPDSVLHSQKFWTEKNILILPNCEWAPLGAEFNLIQALDNCDLSYGLFKSNDPSSWGTVRIDQHEVHLCERPSSTLNNFSAWGLIAFRRAVGLPLFQKLLESSMDHQIKKFPVKASSFNLEDFRELTQPH